MAFALLCNPLGGDYGIGIFPTNFSTQEVLEEHKEAISNYYDKLGTPVTYGEFVIM